MPIPKKIHYCWFGGNPKPESVLKYIETWKKFCPDYQIIEWNESNSELDATDYVREAYNAKMWAYVADYVRLVALVSHGGIYLDTDVEIVKNIDDLLNVEAIAGFEEERYVMTAFLAAQPNHPIFVEWLDSYKDKHFINEDGSLNKTTNVHYLTDLLKDHGLVQNGRKQVVAGVTLYPCDFFSPKDYYTEKIKMTVNTYTIHHFDGSWREKESVWERFKRKHPSFLRFILLPNRIAMFILGDKYKTVKKLFKR